jgi:hypothetical protein
MGQGEAEVMLAFAWLCIRVSSPTVPDYVVQRKKGTAPAVSCEMAGSDSQASTFTG